MQSVSLQPRRTATAIVCALAFLFGAIALFTSNTAKSQGNQTSADPFAQSAINSILADLQQEIALSSSATRITTGGTTSVIYTPLANSAMLPQLSGTYGISAPAPNLLIRSANGQNFYTGGTGIPGNAAAVSSTTPSLDGLSVPMALWNSHYLLPLQAGGTGSTPLAGSFAPPDWVLVAGSGGNPVISNFSGANSQYLGTGTNPIVGRYAYAIYHEGGLLDANVAGYPSTTSVSESGYKPALAYADLTQLPGGLTTAQIDELVAWRNYASAQTPGPSWSSPDFTAASASDYFDYVISDTNGFLSPSTAVYNGQTDQMFTSRQELIAFVQNALGISGTGLNVLNYLTTFSRDLNQPSYISPVQSNAAAPVVLPASLGGNNAFGGDKLINPSFPNVRVQASFTRYNGSTAHVGDPLVNKRFPLQRLAWVTPFGPIADNNGNLNPTGNAAIGQIIAAYQGDGISTQFLALGGATNIANYFGLTWDSTNNRWKYNFELGSNGSNNFIMLVGRPAGTAANSKEYVEDANREPNFFELLKAGIAVGSLGKAAVTSTNAVSSGNVPSGYSQAEVPVNFRYNFDSSADYHVIQIGANILSEVNPTSYPIRITFNDGSSRGTWEFQGVTDLPYLSYVFNGVLRTQLPNPVAPNSWVDSSPFQYPVAVSGSLASSGSAYMIQVPAVWNPYDPNGTPGVVRPSQFRIVIDSNDPISLSIGGSGGDLAIWHGAEAAGSTVAGSGMGYGNQGLAAPGAVYSFNATGVGKTTEKPGGAGTPISDSVTFNDENGALDREPTLIFSTTAPGNATRMNGNITGIDANPLPNESDGSTGPWAPLVLGQMPLAFASGTTTYYTGIGLIGVPVGSGDNRVYFTYRLQYQDPSGNWVTYDTKYGRTTHGMFSFQARNIYSPSVIIGPNYFNAYSWTSAMDPRTARFGLITDTINDGRSRAPIGWDPPDYYHSASWIYNSSGATTTVGITYPIRQDNSGGFGFVNLDANNTPPGAPNNDKNFGLLSAGLPSTTDIPYPSFSAGWTCPLVPINEGHGESDVWIFAPGMYAQNNPSAPFYNGSTIEPSYYADADGVVRGAAGAYVPFGGTASASTTVGLPPPSVQGYPGAPQTSSTTTPATTTPFTQSQSRPLLLHRPFRTVAELGYVFRDLPWKNLDFFTPESGDAGLLDLFCIDDTNTSNDLVAGKMNLNTRQAPVLAAIVSGAYVDDPKVSNVTVGSLSSSAGSTISNALVTRTADTVNYGPLENLSELVGKWNSAVAASGTVTYSPTDPSGTSGVDLPFPYYTDGKLSYAGFSGAASISSGRAENLTDAYAAAAFSNNSQIQTSMSQIQRFREAPVRALANAGQTRVWNLMIDVVAQTGSYPSTAHTLANFSVQGETRYWLHVAIDRLTGQVIDQNLELVPTGPININFSTTAAPAISIPEDQPAGTTVDTLTSADSTSGSTFTYALVSGSGSADNASFTLSGNTLQTAAVLQYLMQSTYSVLVQVTDQDGLSFQEPLTINLQPLAYIQWKINNFGANASNPAVAGDTANPSGDGIPNLVKYAMGLDPLASTTTGITATAANGVMTMTYTMAAAAVGAFVQPWWSTDLQTWSTAGVTQTMLSDNGAIQLWQATVPMSAQGSTLFMRLQISGP